VILWADTFTNYFRPEIGKAAASVLQAAGLNVLIPGERLCCGRPLYDFGFLQEAKRYLRRAMDVLGRQIDEGLPIVVLEPSCASVFRDELRGLYPADPRAERLRRQVFLLSEFLERQVPGYQPPKSSARVLLHGHCHHKAVMTMKDEESILRRMGVELTSLDAGCCGMAGSFGYLKEKYEISRASGERVLLPAVRRAGADTVIVSDGFSCQEQVFQATGRRPLHLAELISQALRRAAPTV
jgi:Fe-S oxidoreductase